MKLDNNMRCLIETLFNRVIDFNERVRNEVVLKVEKKGVVLCVDFNYWTREGRCLHIWAETEEDLKSMIQWLDTALIILTKKWYLKSMIQWLDTELAIAEKDEIDPKDEAQRELDKEQI